MKHHALPSFWKGYRQLDASLQALADKQFDLLENDPRHPSLHFKPVGKFWSARIDRSHRCLAVRKGDDIVWFWIGGHAQYEKLIK
ncbi:MAG: hypothetical protein IPL47_09730 [Phyllobacteriaceae bacterium]|nr:hypothetical protein [Phyllobacteriaceae bacterium]